MTTSPVTVKTLAVLALVVGFASAARAQPAAMTAEKAFTEYKPKQAGVNATTPPQAQWAQCKVSQIANPNAPGKIMGYIVADPNGQPVRQFVTYDNKNWNIVSFYLEGVEAYRETYPVGEKEPYQFRWLGPNGTKWGLDHNRDFVIDDWAVISPEEVSQEVLKAIAANDPKKLAPLMITKEHLAAIGLPAAEVEGMLKRAANAGTRLNDTAGQLKLSDKAKWSHADFGVPQTRPADSFGAGQVDYTAYKNGTVFVEDGANPRLFQTGELVQVGRAWKIVDGPAAGGAPIVGPDPKGPIVEPQIQPWVDQLNDLDKKGPAGQTPEAVAKFYAERAGILEHIVARATNRESWVKMLLDSCAQAAEGGKGDNPYLKRIKQWRDVELAKGQNMNVGIASYASYRALVADNNIALREGIKPEDFAAAHEKWRTGLDQFMKDFSATADAPEAALRLAMAWEMSSGKDVAEIKANEERARKWYEYLVKNHATHAHATKATGALKRLDCEGKPLELSGPLLSDPTKQFNAAQPGKVVVVYFWAGWDAQTLADDAKKLTALQKEYGPKGLEIVTVGLAHDAKTAATNATTASLPGTHLYAPGGLDSSPLTAAYGILAPPHILVVGKDGKITNRNSHIGMLEDEVKKLTAEK